MRTLPQREGERGKGGRAGEEGVAGGEDPRSGIPEETPWEEEVVEEEVVEVDEDEAAAPKEDTREHTDDA